jgi:hypothetical protein
MIENNEITDTTRHSLFLCTTTRSLCTRSSSIYQARAMTALQNTCDVPHKSARERAKKSNRWTFPPNSNFRRLPLLKSVEISTLFLTLKGPLRVSSPLPLIFGGKGTSLRIVRTLRFHKGFGMVGVPSKKMNLSRPPIFR